MLFKKLFSFFIVSWKSGVKTVPKIKKMKIIYEKRIIVIIAGFIIEITEEYKRSNFEYNNCKAKV